MFHSKVIITLFCVGLCYAQAQTTGKHDIIVSSAAIQNLYRSCGNFVNINVPDLCSDYNPICTATDAEIQQSTEAKRKFLIVPRGNKCTLSVSNNIGENPEPLGSIVFNVIEPPKPMTEVLVNGQRISSSTQVAKGSRITIKIVPDPEFAAAMAQDAKYGIDKIKFFTQCGLGAPQMVGEVNTSSYNAAEGINIPVPGEAFNCPSGSKIFMEISDRYRINFKGQKVPDISCTLYENNISFLSR